MYLHSCCCFGVIWYVVVVVVVVFHVAREKKVMTKKFKPFFIRVFSIFSHLAILAISLRGSVARIQSKKNTNNNRLI